MKDQLDTLFPLVDDKDRPGGFEDRTAYHEWTVTVFAVGLGRRPGLGIVLLDERVVPFLVASEKGATPAGRELRRRLHRRIVWEFCAPAQDRFAKKAREETRPQVEYIRQPAQKSAWEAWDQRRQQGR